MLFTFLPFMFYESTDEATFHAMVKGAFPDLDDDDDAMKIIEMYSRDENITQIDRIADILNDAYFQHGVERFFFFFLFL